MSDAALRTPAPRGPGQARGLRERKKREKLARITQAASELFRAQGFEATTGRQICERAGIGTGTLFLYVSDKRELLSLIFQPRAARVFARLTRDLAADETLVEGLMRLFGAFYRLYARDPALSRLFVQELLFRGNPDPGMRALSAELRSRLAEQVAQAQARGELRADVSVETLAQATAAHYVFWLQLWLGTGAVGRRAAERGLRGALELQLDGIAQREGARA